MYYVIYEDYTEYTQFEGQWYFEYQEFSSLKECKDWIKNSQKAKAAKMYGRTLIGPLKKV